MSRQIFITGVSSGIGLSLVKAFLAQDATVYGISRRSPEELLSNSRFHFQSLDLASVDEIPARVDSFLSEVSDLDLVVLNAAVLGSLADLRDTPLEKLQRIMDINVWANKLLLDSLYSRSRTVRQVVAISSGAAVSPSRGWGGYSISKAALNMMIALYASERPESHFSSLAPGIVDTAMQEYISSLPDDSRFPAIGMLKAARGTPYMPPPDAVAGKLIEAFSAATKHPSGGYLDLQKLLRK